MRRTIKKDPFGSLSPEEKGELNRLTFEKVHKRALDFGKHAVYGAQGSFELTASVTSEMRGPGQRDRLLSPGHYEKSNRAVIAKPGLS